MIAILQFLAVIFSLVMIYFALLNYRRRELSGSEMLIWFAIWVAAILVVVFPDLLRVFAKTFLFARLFDLLVVGALTVIVVMVSRAYMTTKRMEKKLEKYVRKEALSESSNDKRIKS